MAEMTFLWLYETDILEILQTEDTTVCNISLKTKGNKPKGNSLKEKQPHPPQRNTD